MALGPDWLRERRFWRPSVDRDLDDELAFHLAMRAEIYRESGLDAQAARDAALQRFGDVADVRARCLTISHERERRMRRLEVWSTARQHARHALRRLRTAPAFAATVVLMLALGVGATTAVFTVVDGVLLRPLPFHRPDRLVSLSHTLVVSGVDAVQQSEGTFLLYQRHATSLDGIGIYRIRDVNVGALDGRGTESERVPAVTVSASLLPVLGVAPQLGRAIRPGEDRVGAPHVALVSASLWRRKFGGDPAIVGRSLVVDGVAREVVGVLPDDFHFPTPATGIWLPLRLDPPNAQIGSFNFTAVGRLRPGVTLEAARAELARILPRVIEEFPSPISPAMWAQAQVRPVVAPLRDVVVGDVSRLLWILLGAVALLLAVACANVASLFLVRAEGAQRELAVRTALGAGRGAVLAHYVGEAAILGLLGGGGGVLLAWLGVRALRTLPSGVDLPRLTEVGIDARVLMFAAAASVLSALAVSVLPVLRARRITPAVVLKESSRGATVGRDRQHARSLLVVVQVALALVLVASSALMARSFSRLRAVRPGFDARGVLTLRVALPGATYPDAASVTRFYDRLLAEVRALPGVRSAAVTDWLPLTSDHSDTSIQVEDRPLPPDAVPPAHTVVSTSADYFVTMGIPLLAGRALAPQEGARLLREVVVSRAFAERYWKGESAIGRRVRANLDGGWSTVVGVVGDVHLASLARPAEDALYFPIVTEEEGAAVASRAVALTVRGAGPDPAALGPAVRAIVRRIDPTLPTYDERPMDAVLAAAAAGTRFTMLVLGVASLVALTIGAVGLYGVMAYGVTLRRREIGVRMALGAAAADVSRMVARRGLVLAGIGVLAGLAATLATTRFLGGLLYGVSPTDPAALAATCAVLLAVAAVASWLPARRAATMDPMEALRRE